MPKQKKKPTGQSKEQSFTPQEIGVALNNAVVAAFRPQNGEISEARLRTLRAYTQAATEVMFEHVEEGLLTAEELVAVLAAAALFAHGTAVFQGKNMPKMEESKFLMEKNDES